MGSADSLPYLKPNRRKTMKRIDLTGQRFGRLLVIEEAGKDKQAKLLWKCLCDCGNVKIIRRCHLRSGLTKSCGCLRRRIGKDNPRYNSNITDKERIVGRKYYEYYEWREAVFKRDSYTCQVCGDSTGGNLNAHHLESYNNNPKLRTKLSNGATTCDKCHGNFHHQYGYGNNTKKQFEEFKGETNDKRNSSNTKRS